MWKSHNNGTAMRCSSNHRSLPPAWRSIIISLCSLPPRSPPCLGVCVSVRGVRGSTRLVLGDTVRPRSPPPWSPCSPFYSSFPSSSAQLDSDASEQLDSDVRGSAFNHLTLLNGGEGRKKIVLLGGWHTQSLPASSPALTCLQPGVNDVQIRQPVVPSQILWIVIFGKVKNVLVDERCAKVQVASCLGSRVQQRHSGHAIWRGH